MHRSTDIDELRAAHQPHSIRERLSQPMRHSYLADAVLGAIDGCVTTFAVVAAVTGAGFSGLVAIVLGVANLVADGFSMAVSNYQGTKSQREELERARRAEEQHIDLIPEGEREEIRQIFASKGFEGDVLERIVETITADRRLWVDTMLKEEHGLPLETPHPVYAGGATFAAFVVVGFIPLIAFFLPALSPQTTFAISAVMTALAFAGVGVLKGRLVEGSPMRSGIETLINGGGAAILAYVAGAWLRSAFGV